MKKLLLLLLLSVLMGGNIKDVYASSFSGSGASFAYEDKCGCGGEFMTKYIEPLSPIYRWRGFNHKIYNGYFNNYTVIDFGRGANGDICFFVEAIYSYSASNSNKNYSSYVIYISEDEAFDCYDKDGNIIQKDLSDFSRNGIANNKFYGFYGIAAGSAGNWVHEYDDGYNYFIHTEGVHSEVLNKLEELAIFLCGGENATFPDGITVGTPLPVYDLEPPLDLKVTTVELDLFTDIPYKIWWNQSNIDLTGYNTVFYVKGYGQYKPSVFSAYKDLETVWMFEESIVTAKYCNNNLKYFDYSYEDMQRDLRAIAENIEGDSIYQVKNNSVDFMIRNEKEDENGQMHYSNWVYVNTYEDGTYSVYEMKQDYTLDEDSDETGQINTDSTIYDDELVYEDTEETLDVGGVSNVGSFIKVMKDLANSLKTFPEFFAKMFSFLPSWVLTCIGILFIIILICAIF